MSLTGTILSGGLVAVVLFVLAKPALKKGKYIKDLASVGTKVEDLTKSDLVAGAPEYDVVVIGGGTSGCVLAARLSENPDIRVLLLEAGGSGVAQSYSRLPGGYTYLYGMKGLVHHYWTESQLWAKGAKKFWPRGQLLGGCSSINAQMAQWGAKGDYDEWASIIGDDSWSWQNFSKYFRKFENFQPHPQHSEIDTSAHGTTGPVQIGFYNHVSRWASYFVRSAVAAGIPSTPDFNGKDLDTKGAARILTYVDNKHERVSSESAYLTPEVLARPNLKVAVHATVTRILFDTTSEKPRAVGAEFARLGSSPRYQVKARKELVVCGGAIQSPTILMHSGIGPAQHLKDKEIPVLVDLPGVGSHLMDHPIVDLNFLQKGSIDSIGLFRPQHIGHVLKFAAAIFQYQIGMGGPLAMNFGEAAAFIRSDDPSLFPPAEYPEKLEDSSSAKDSPDLEYFSTPMVPMDHGREFHDGLDTFGLHVYLLRPLSTGTVLLSDGNPFHHPLIDPKYLQNPHDVKKLVRGFRLGLKIAQQDPLKSVLNLSTTRYEFDQSLHLKSDAELESIIRKRVETVYHPTSTCRMEKRENGGVVDAKLRVYGVDGLRVCDASVFPKIVSGHTAGACFAVGEKLADMIKEEVSAGKN